MQFNVKRLDVFWTGSAVSWQLKTYGVKWEVGVQRSDVNIRPPFDTDTCSEIDQTAVVTNNIAVDFVPPRVPENIYWAISL
ncbi:hypothetical protein EVAR_60464_1 [Eumeta japonica]|uniref:Uncharacterized protein n=1 Tax=Eumeta variegata TaxID=151549 RepID=A0A4C1Z518_EUMVA|nr:hypothetical protein EVAR_60464_1 [Eumeta japonica]